MHTLNGIIEYDEELIKFTLNCTDTNSVSFELVDHEPEVYTVEEFIELYGDTYYDTLADFKKDRPSSFRNWVSIEVLGVDENDLIEAKKKEGWLLHKIALALDVRKNVYTQTDKRNPVMFWPNELEYIINVLRQYEDVMDCEIEEYPDYISKYVMQKHTAPSSLHLK